MGTHNRARTGRGARRLMSAVAAAGIASCVTTLGGPAGSEGGGASGDSSSAIVAGRSGATEEPREQGAPPCGAATRDALLVLESYCAGCHGAESAGQGGFDSVLDVAALKAEGKVVPLDPTASPLYARMLAGTMPPASVQRRPSQADVEAVGEWITCGAPAWDDPGASTYAFVSIDARLRAILGDLRSFENPADRKRLRYFDLSNLANAGYSYEQVEQYRESVGLLVNSLSMGRAVVAPAQVDDAGLLLRIDMRDYVWDAETWQLLESDYPYAVRYDPNSRLFPYDEVSADQIRRETGATVPYLQADWFLSHASRPPLYHDILELPGSLVELEARVGVDISQDVASGLVSRAAFQDAGPSRNHRVIERHELSGSRGALWVSYDFTSNVGDRNVFANPLDFAADGMEIAFNLDNGLMAYFLADADGRRRDKAERSLVQDPLARDGAVENGLSCMNCHQTDGVLARTDEMRSLILQTGSSAQQIEDVLTLYPENETLQAFFSQDQNRYRSARSALGAASVATDTFHTIDRTHQGVLDLDAVAAILGVEPARFERAIDASPQVFPAEVAALRSPGGGVQRDAFEAAFGRVLEGLGLGAALAEEEGLVQAADDLEAGASPPEPESSVNQETAEGTLEAETDAGSDGDADAGVGDAGVGPGSAPNWWISQGATW